MNGTGFPHSDIAASRACTRLGGAFRSVPRPSSAAGGQASPVCPFLLAACAAETSRLRQPCELACVDELVKLHRRFPPASPHRDGDRPTDLSPCLERLANAADKNSPASQAVVTHVPSGLPLQWLSACVTTPVRANLAVLCPSLFPQSSVLMTQHCLYSTPPPRPRQHWWRWGDSNPQPTPCKGVALPPELHPRV